MAKLRRSFYGNPDTGLIGYVVTTNDPNPEPIPPVYEDWIDVLPGDGHHEPRDMYLKRQQDGSVVALVREKITVSADAESKKVGENFLLSVPEGLELILLLDGMSISGIKNGSKISFSELGRKVLQLAPHVQNVPYRMDPIILEVNP